MISRLFCGTLILLYVSTGAQNSFRFADSTAIWNQLETYLLEGSSGTFPTYQTGTYRIDRDTFLNNFYYQKITPNYLEPVIFVRQDSSGKVFYYDKDYQLERMVFDFSLVKGDTLLLHNPYNQDTARLIVDSTDTTIYGTSKKRMFIRCDSTYNPNCFDDIWISGIGSLNSFFLNPFANEYECIPGCYFNLACYQENGVTYKFASTCFVDVQEISFAKVKIYPNPANDYLNIEGIKQQTTFQLYNLLGKEVLTTKLLTGTNLIEIKNLTNGIYIYRVIGESRVGKVFIEK